MRAFLHLFLFGLLLGNLVTVSLGTLGTEDEPSQGSDSTTDGTVTSKDTLTVSSVTTPATPPSDSSETSDVTSPPSESPVTLETATADDTNTPSSSTSVSPVPDSSTQTSEVTSNGADDSSSVTIPTSVSNVPSASETATENGSVGTTPTINLSSPENSPSTGTTGPSDSCKDKPCGEEASCVNLHRGYFCLCREGYYYRPKTCVKGKTFIGEITAKETETSDLENITSPAYEELYNDIKEFFEGVFKTPDYGQTVILKVSMSPSQSARSAMRANKETVYISAANIFEQNTVQDEDSVTSLIKTALQGNSKMAGYSNINLCDYRGCEQDDSDNCQYGSQCNCKPGFQQFDLQSAYCFRSEQCPEDCNTKVNEQCLKSADGTLGCACLPGYQRDDEGSCKECPFGYSGTDCKDQFQLILTIVGTIAGALILSMLIALIVISSRSNNRKRNVEEQKLIENDFHGLQLQQTGFSNFGADNSIFPKVKTGVPRTNLTQNPYSSHPGMPRPDY